MKNIITAAFAFLMLLAAAPARSTEPFPSTLGFDSEAQMLKWLPRHWAALRVGSWNTMLQPWLPYEAGVIQTIAQTNLDVLALQEVWTEAAKNRIVNDAGVRARYPYHYYAPALQEPGFCIAVPTFFQEDFINCLTRTGTDTRAMEQPVTPVTEECKREGLFLTLSSQPCKSCIVSSMQSLSPDIPPLSVIDLCEEGDGVRYAHDGRPGLLILSKRPLQSVEFVPYDTADIKRAMVYATIAGVRFAFVHWPANFLADFDSSLGEYQVGSLQPDLANDLIARKPAVIVGDFNSGPDYQPAGHNRLVANGYTPLYNKPTYCPSATHAAFAPCRDGTTNWLSSVRGPLSIDNIYINTNAGYCLPATFARTPVSDHVGLAALCGLRR
jgi:endonuclease/exonuclease/phosphatase family metal-dependent hydrolase